MRKRHAYRSLVAEGDFDTVLATAPDPALEPAAAAGQRELQAALTDAIHRLAEPYRSVVVLREIDELTYAEIAEALELPMNTVKVYLHRGRRKLREQLRERVAHDEL